MTTRTKANDAMIAELAFLERATLDIRAIADEAKVRLQVALRERRRTGEPMSPDRLDRVASDLRRCRDLGAFYADRADALAAQIRDAS